MHDYVPKTVRLMRIRLFQCTTDPQVNFQPIIVHHDSVGELAEHDRIGGVHLFTAVDVFLEGIHPVFHFCESSRRCFELPLPFLQLVHLLAVGGDFDLIVHLTHRTLFLGFVEGENGFLYGYDVQLYLIQFCAITSVQNLCTAFLYHIQYIVYSVECCPDCALQYILVDMVAVAL